MLTTVILAALALATLSHEGPDGHDRQNDSNRWQNDLFGHECVEKLVVKLGFLIRTRRVYLLHIHIDVRIGVVLSQLLEPLIACHLLVLPVALLILEVLQVLVDHIFRDLEAFGDLKALRQPEILRQLDAFGKDQALRQLLVCKRSLS